MIRRYGYPGRRLLAGSLALLLGGVGLALVTRGFADHADLAGAVVGTALALRGGYRLLRLWTDRRWPVPVAGRIVAIEPWRSRTRGRGHPDVVWLHRILVDEGTRTTAWAARVPHGYRVGQTVTLTGLPWRREIVRPAWKASRTRTSGRSGRR